MGKILPYITFIAIAVSACGCATIYNPATQKNELILIDDSTEIAIGKTSAEQIHKRYKILNDPILEQRIKRIGTRIAKVSHRQNIEYRFAIVEDKELNAFTLPGGFIYLNSGLINALDDDEIAYVIAHEIGHLAARHIVKKIQANMAYQLISSLVLFSLGKSNGSNIKMINNAIDTVYSLVELRYSREDEYEADRLAVYYSYKAGFNPYAAITCLMKLKKEEKDKLKLLRYFRTHPYVDERIQALLKYIPTIVR